MGPFDTAVLARAGDRGERITAELTRLESAHMQLLIDGSGATRNSSRDYDYLEWVATGRATAAQNVDVETRKRPGTSGSSPRPEESSRTPAPSCTPRSRTPRARPFSIDFRTVNRHDVERGAGAANVDSECTGTNLALPAGTALQTLPPDVIDHYFSQLTDCPER